MQKKCIFCTYFCGFICIIQKKAVPLQQIRKNMIDPKANMVEAPVMETSFAGNRNEYLTADELMQRLEPHIRSLFR